MAEQINSVAIRMNTSDVDGAIQSLDALATRGPKVERAVDQIGQASQRTGKSLQTLGQGAGTGLTEVGKRSEDASRSISRTYDSVAQLASGLKGLTVTGVTAFLGNQVVQAASAAADALLQASIAGDRLKTSLNFSTGGRATQEIDYLRNLTNGLGLQFASTADAYAKFSAAADGTALAGQKTKDVFESVAKASAVLGLSADETSGVLLALQQMVSKGVVQSEELRGQLGERLPGAFQIAAKAMGVTTAELGKMLEQGEVIADDFLPKFARQLELTFGDAAEKAGGRLAASNTRVADSWMRLKQVVGDSGVSSAIGGQYEILADGLNGVAESIERAKLEGDGFFGQLAAGSGALLRFLNPLQAFSYEAISSGNALRQAQEELDKYQKKGYADSPNPYLKAEYYRTQQLIEKLKEAQEEMDRLRGKNAQGPVGVQASLRNFDVQREGAIATAMQKVLDNLSGVKNTFFKDLNDLYAGYAAGLIDLKTYQESVAKLTKESGGVKAARSDKKDIDDNAQALARYIDGLQRELTVTEDLTDRQKALDLLKSLGATGEIAQVRELVLGMAQKVTIAKQDEALTKSRLKDQEDEAQRLKDLNDELDKLSGRTDDDRKRALTTQLETRLNAGESFTPEELERIVKGIAGIKDEVKSATSEMDEFTKQAARNIQDAFGETILKTIQGDFKNIGALWLDLLQRMASQALAANLGKYLFGDFAKTGDVGGLFSKGLDAIGNYFVPQSSYWADGGAFDRGGSVRMFANGDVFDSPTAFKYGRDSIGVMGEAGPEAVMPLQRGKDGRLGVAVQGGGGGGGLNLSLSFGSGVTRAEVQALIPTIVKQVQTAVQQQQRRSATMGTT